MTPDRHRIDIGSLFILVVIWMQVWCNILFLSSFLILLICCQKDFSLQIKIILTFDWWRCDGFQIDIAWAKKVSEKEKDICWYLLIKKAENLLQAQVVHPFSSGPAIPQGQYTAQARLRHPLLSLGKPGQSITAGRASTENTSTIKSK